jgi:NADH-quinone oxidoreductase subunit A
LITYYKAADYHILIKVFSAYRLIFAHRVRPMIYLLQTSLDSASAGSYLPVGIQVLFAVGLVAFLMFVTHLLGPKRKTTDKLQNFASGIESHGDARQPMAIKYFLTAILFVLFDVEVIFFYPYAVNFQGLGWAGFWAVLMFVGFFLCGFIYILKKGALNWED